MRLDDVMAVIDALEKAEVRYAVFGAMAMAAHGLERATRDLGLFVAVDEDNIARLRQALGTVFDDPELQEITADDLAGEYPVIQYGPADADYTIDIVGRLGDAFAFDDLEILTTSVGTSTLRVVSPATLYLMKHDTVRPRDRDDAARLRRAFDVGE
ncbi:MAG TPA: nucleotidyl transferase AbiEii/AbiGii toxin family protein [Egibacteraceae bacterium]|nr:nucleotidyl transferase AbiEii/AbiGii toxin family protein [Egibacteraceae bacterium]